jgi:flagellar P-ring protein precursor FlgI
MKLRLALALAAALVAVDAHAVSRIKDITTVQGVRENQLLGYGLVIGLQGTGDSTRNAPFTEQSMKAMLDRLGINIQDASLRVKNVAAVAITANLPAFATTGSRIDVNVASIGDASSLKGGTLLMTPLAGPDGEVYAVAQGPVTASGFSAAGEAESITQGVPTDARIPNGAIVEREVPGALKDFGGVALELINPDFKTAVLVADAINAFTMRQFGRALAHERDMRSVLVDRPRDMNVTRFIAAIGDLPVEPDQPARVVIDQRTGTVVIGEDVRISTVALTHGNLTVRISEQPEVSQPAPFSDGETLVVPRTIVDTEEDGGPIGIVEGADLRSLVKGLNLMGLKPSGIIAILQTIKSAGALQAELVVQ